MFSLAQSAQIIIYVIVGGLGTLVGPMIGGVLVHYLTGWLGTQTLVNNSLVMGLILVVFVLLVPRGLVPSLGLLGRRIRVGGGGVDVAALRDDTPSKSPPHSRGRLLSPSPSDEGEGRGGGVPGGGNP